MAEIKLTKRRTAKNGMSVYKADSKRTSGSVYFDKKMFGGNAPDSVTVTAEGLVIAAPEQPAAQPTSQSAQQAQEQANT